MRTAPKPFDVLVAAGPWCVMAATAAADVRIIRVVVDGRDIPIDVSAAADTAPIRVPSNAGRILFVFEGESGEGDAGRAAVPGKAVGGKPAAVLPPLRGTRLRYRLDGVDADWRDAPAHGRLSLIFLDADGNTVGSSDAKIHGTTEGWRGLPESSSLKAFSLSAVAPPLASSVIVNFLSSGGDEVVGAMAIDESCSRSPLRAASRVGMPCRSMGSATKCIRWRRRQGGDAPDPAAR